MARPSQAQMDLLEDLIGADGESDSVARLVVSRADMRTLHACHRAGWLTYHEGHAERLWSVSETGRAAVKAGVISNATDKVNVRVPDALREKVDEKNRRIGSTTTAVIIDALRRYVAEDDERSALRLEARTAPDIRARREAGKAGQ